MKQNIIYKIQYYDLRKSRWLITICFFLFVVPLYSQKTDTKAICEKVGKITETIDYADIEKFEEHLDTLTQTLALLKENECWDNYMGCLNGLMIIYYYQRDYDEASRYAEKTIKAGKKYGLEQSYNYSVAISTKAFFVEDMGDYEASIKLQKESLQMMVEQDGGKDVIATIQENIGNSYFLKGDYQVAISYFEEALLAYSAKQSNEDRHAVARIFMYIGNCYKSMGQFEQAFDYYQQSLSLHQKLPREQFYEQTERLVYKGLVELPSNLEDRYNTIDHIERAVAIHQKYPDLLMAYQSYLSFGKFYLEEQAFDKAQQYFEFAKTAAYEEYKLYERHPGMALTEAALGGLYKEKRNWTATFQHYQSALELISVDFESDDRWPNPTVVQLADKLVGFEILQAKAAALHLYSQDKNGGQAALKQAFQTYLLLESLIKNVRQSYLIDDSKFVFAEKALPVYEQAIEVSLELHRLTQDEYYLEHAFLFAEANKAATLYEAIANERAKSIAIPESMLKEERRIRIALTYNEKTLLEEKQKKEPEQEYLKQLSSKIFALKEQYMAISQQLENEYPSYFQLKVEEEALTLEDIRTHLDRKMVLVAFMVGEKNSYAFFITRRKLEVYPIDLNAVALSDRVFAMRKYVSKPPAYEENVEDYYAFTKTAHELYQSLLEKGLNDLRTGIDRLVIIPDASLSDLPFELLLKSAVQQGPINYAIDHLSYLLEDYAICYQYSARLMNLQFVNDKNTPGDHKFIGFAPQFGQSKLQATRSCDGNELSNLRFSKEEVNKISELLEGEVRLGDDAELDDFLKEAPFYSIVHLATHACINEDEAYLNRIFFTNSNCSQLELSTLQLNAELVVLSACNTGVGKLLKGEGVMSLARGFMQAGGNSLLTSLWAVDDHATAVQMVAYYENLMKGLPKDVALKEAKMSYLNQVDPEMMHPFYWSAFVQFGKVKEIVETKAGARRYLIPIILMLGIAFAWGGWRWRARQS